MQLAQNHNVRFLLGAILVALLCIAAYSALNMRDTRTPGEKLGDAFSKVDEGVDDAARELQNRTPLERASDEVKDATDGSPQ